MRTPLRRSPSAASLRTQTIARLIDCDGLVRRDTAEEDQLRKLKLAYQVRRIVCAIARVHSLFTASFRRARQRTTTIAL
jgi:hypothetical protein